MPMYFTRLMHQYPYVTVFLAIKSDIIIELMKKTYYLLIGILVFCMSYFTVWQKDISFPVVSSITTVLFSLPALIGVIKWLGVRIGLLLVASLGLFAYFIEIVGLLTGFPYGHFTYSSNVGVLLFEFIPISLPFAWAPLMIGAVALSYKHKSNVLLFLLSTVAFLLAIDVILDPGAVYLGFWSYGNGGVWYNVPISNYIGWVISGAVGFTIMYFFAKSHSNPPTYITMSYFYSVVFWTGVCVFGGVLGGAIIGFFLVLLLLKIIFIDNLSLRKDKNL